jgi:predicted DNA-binding protein
MSQRTQIYLSSEQRAKIDQRMKRDGLSLAAVVREALDRYLVDEPIDLESALEATFGAIPELEVPRREEWNRG